MDIFHYIATDHNARTVEGQVEATDERTAVRELQQSGYFPIKVVRGESRSPGSRGLKEVFSVGGLGSRDVLQLI